MKKIISSILCLLMIVGFAFTAFGSESPPTQSLVTTDKSVVTVFETKEISASAERIFIQTAIANNLTAQQIRFGRRNYNNFVGLTEIKRLETVESNFSPPEKSGGFKTFSGFDNPPRGKI